MRWVGRSCLFFSRRGRFGGGWVDLCRRRGRRLPELRLWTSLILIFRPCSRERRSLIFCWCVLFDWELFTMLFILLSRYSAEQYRHFWRHRFMCSARSKQNGLFRNRWRSFGSRRSRCGRWVIFGRRGWWRVLRWGGIGWWRCGGRGFPLFSGSWRREIWCFSIFLAWWL